MFLRNPRFLGLKFPDMSRPETLEKRYVGKVRPAPARRFCRTQWYGFGLHTGTDVAAVCGVAWWS